MLFCEEINYPELSDEETFDKVYKKMSLRDTYIKNIYCNSIIQKCQKEIIETNYILWGIIIKEKWYLLMVCIICMNILLRYIIMNIYNLYMNLYNWPHIWKE